MSFRFYSLLTLRISFFHIGDGEVGGDATVFYRNAEFIDNVMSAKNSKYKSGTGYRIPRYEGTVDYPLKDERFNLGATDRFVLTSAFDLTDDGYPDIIHVNESNVYSVSKNGKIMAINRFMSY